MIRWLLTSSIALTIWFSTEPSICLAGQIVVVVLDDSGSMKETMRTPRGQISRINAAKQALAKVLSTLPANTQVGVLALNTQFNGSNWVVPLGAADANRWHGKIDGIRAEGGTPLGQFIRNAADELLKQRASERYGVYRMLVVTDGEANDGPLLEAILPDVLSRGLVMDVIGVDMKAAHSLATRAHSYRRADDEQSLEQAISEVFAETSDQNQDNLSDFEMLAGLPDEFAVESLQALGRIGNNPIGTTVSLDASGEPVTTVNIPPAVLDNPGNGTIGDILGGVVCCFGTCVAVIVLIGVLVNANTKLKRRR